MIDALARWGRGLFPAEPAEDQDLKDPGLKGQSLKGLSLKDPGLKEERCCHVSDEIDARFRYFAVPVPGTVKDRRRRRLESVA